MADGWGSTFKKYGILSFCQQTGIRQTLDYGAKEVPLEMRKRLVFIDLQLLSIKRDGFFNRTEREGWWEIRVDRNQSFAEKNSYKIADRLVVAIVFVASLIKLLSRCIKTGADEVPKVFFGAFYIHYTEFLNRRDECLAYFSFKVSKF